MKKALFITLALLATILVIVGCSYNVDLTLTRIEVTTTPTGHQYVGCGLNTTGMVVTGYYNRSNFNTGITGYTTSPTIFTTTGTNLVEVTYEGKSTSFNVEVEVCDKVEIPASIKVVSSNSDLYYNDFDNTKFKTSDLGVVIEVEYLDGTKTTKTDKDFTMFSSTISGGSVVTKEDNKVHTFTIYYTENGVTQKTSFDYNIVVYTSDNYVMIAGKDLLKKVLNGTPKTSITDIEFCESLPEVSVSYTTNLDSGNLGFVKGYLTSDNKIYIVGKKILGNEDCSYMFSDSSNFSTKCFTSLTDINGIENFDTSKVTNMSRMFCYCYELTTLDLSNFDTSKVTNMSRMFQCCSELTTLNLSSFETSSVIDMNTMFLGCSGLTTLDLSNFDTSKVNSIRDMFHGCSGLTTIYASIKWNTGNVLSSMDMFKDCSSLVGGAGTTLETIKTKTGSYSYDKTYAKIDGGTSSPGYFTAK